MTLLDNHLEQISLSSAAISELPFPPPKIFTNAILHSRDITNLIRDTESHERALFTLAALEQGPNKFGTNAARRSTVYGPNGTAGAVGRQPGQRSAVAALLAGDLGNQIRRQAVRENGNRTEPDVNALLDGAAKLCGVYPIAGAPEKITASRSRFEVLQSSIEHYEDRESKQMAQLARLNKQMNGEKDYDEDDEDAEVDSEDEFENQSEALQVTEEDLRKEEEEIRLLEEKKRALEERVTGMERDLGGLLR